jgi:hypothetical protein
MTGEQIFEFGALALLTGISKRGATSCQHLIRPSDPSYDRSRSGESYGIVVAVGPALAGHFAFMGTTKQSL